jgi:glycine/D-amino acid oxidase-like deaminating enzyme
MVERDACGVLQLAASARQFQQQEAVLKAGVLPATMVRRVTADEASALAGVPIGQPALWFPDGGWVDPASFCRTLLHGLDVRLSTAVAGLRHDGSLWHAVDADGQGLEKQGLEAADIVVLTGGLDHPDTGDRTQPESALRHQPRWLPDPGAGRDACHRRHLRHGERCDPRTGAKCGTRRR